MNRYLLPGGAAAAALLVAVGCNYPSQAKPDNSMRLTGEPRNDAAVAAATPGASPTIRPETHFAAGRVHEREGNYLAAAEQYYRATQANPRYVMAFNRLGIVYGRLKLFQAADQAFARAITLEPRRAFLRNNQAFCKMLAGEYAAAEQALRKALALDPQYRRAMVNLGVVLARTNRFDESAETFAQVLPREVAFHNVGVLCLADQRFDVAATAFENALAVNAKARPSKVQLERLRKLTSGGDPRAAATFAAQNERFLRTLGAGPSDAATASAGTAPQPKIRSLNATAESPRSEGNNSPADGDVATVAVDESGDEEGESVAAALDASVVEEERVDADVAASAMPNVDDATLGDEIDVDEAAADESDCDDDVETTDVVDGSLVGEPEAEAAAVVVEANILGANEAAAAAESSDVVTSADAEVVLGDVAEAPTVRVEWETGDAAGEGAKDVEVAEEDGVDEEIDVDADATTDGDGAERVEFAEDAMRDESVESGDAMVAASGVVRSDATPSPQPSGSLLGRPQPLKGEGVIQPPAAEFEAEDALTFLEPDDAVAEAIRARVALLLSDDPACGHAGVAALVDELTGGDAENAEAGEVTVQTSDAAEINDGIAHEDDLSVPIGMVVVARSYEAEIDLPAMIREDGDDVAPAESGDADSEADLEDDAVDGDGDESADATAEDEEGDCDEDADDGAMLIADTVIGEGDAELEAAAIEEGEYVQGVAAVGEETAAAASDEVDTKPVVAAALYFKQRAAASIGDWWSQLMREYESIQAEQAKAEMDGGEDVVGNGVVVAGEAAAAAGEAKDVAGPEWWMDLPRSESSIPAEDADEFSNGGDDADADGFSTRSPVGSRLNEDEDAGAAANGFDARESVGPPAPFEGDALVADEAVDVIEPCCVLPTISDLRAGWARLGVWLCEHSRQEAMPPVVEADSPAAESEAVAVVDEVQVEPVEAMPALPSMREVREAVARAHAWLLNTAEWQRAAASQAAEGGMVVAP